MRDLSKYYIDGKVCPYLTENGKCHLDRRTCNPRCYYIENIIERIDIEQWKRSHYKE